MKEYNFEIQSILWLLQKETLLTPSPFPCNDICLQETDVNNNEGYICLQEIDVNNEGN